MSVALEDSRCRLHGMPFLSLVESRKAIGWNLVPRHKKVVLHTFCSQEHPRGSHQHSLVGVPVSYRRLPTATTLDDEGHDLPAQRSSSRQSLLLHAPSLRSLRFWSSSLALYRQWPVRSITVVISIRSTTACTRAARAAGRRFSLSDQSSEYDSYTYWSDLRSSPETRPSAKRLPGGSCRLIRAFGVRSNPGR